MYMYVHIYARMCVRTFVCVYILRGKTTFMQNTSFSNLESCGGPRATLPMRKKNAQKLFPRNINTKTITKRPAIALTELQTDMKNPTSNKGMLLH